MLCYLPSEALGPHSLLRPPHYAKILTFPCLPDLASTTSLPEPSTNTSTSTSSPRVLPRPTSSRELVPAIELDLDGAADLQRRNSRPDAALTLADPVVNSVLCGILQKPEEVGGRELGDDGQTCAGDIFVEQEAADGGAEVAEFVELVEAVLDLEDDEFEDGHGEFPAAVLAGIGVVQVRAQEGRKVGAGLGHDEVVYVVQLGYAVQRRLAVLVEGVRPRAEGGFCGWTPRDDCAGVVFALEDYGIVEGGGGSCVGGEGSGPDKLGVSAEFVTDASYYLQHWVL